MAQINKRNQDGLFPDHPIPMEGIADQQTIFNIIRENIETLWESTKPLRTKKIASGVVASGTGNGDVTPPAETNNHSALINLSNNDHPQYIPAQFFGYDAEGGVSLDTDGEDLLIKTEVKEDPEYIHDTDSAEVEIVNSGTYEIIAECGFALEDGDGAELSIHRDDGDGYLEIEGALAFASV